MNDEREIQDWFKRSVEELSQAPFTQAVLEEIQGHERKLRSQHYAALGLAICSLCLLLPKLVAPLELIAALPLAARAIVGEQWSVLVVAAIALAWGLRKLLPESI